MKRLHKIFMSVLIVALFLGGFVLGSPAHAKMEEADQEAIYKVINKLEDYYERRKITKFIDLFSQQKFFNYIAFKEAVEGDFDLYKDIRLKRIDERLYLAESRAIYQAVWEKQYRPSLNAPFERQRGLVRIMLEKFGGKWKIIDLQGYPIFGTSGLALPDLVVKNVWIMGGGRRIVGVIENIGSGVASRFYVGFYANNTLLGKAYVASLSKGHTENISWVWTPDPTRRLSDVKVVVDVSHKVKELREDNNVGKVSIKPGDTSYCVDLLMDDLYVPATVQPGLPVLVGNIVTKAPEGDVKTVKVGDKLRICVAFRNIGGLNATKVPVKVYYVTERPDKTVTIFQRVYPQVPSKGRIRFCFFWKVPELERKPSVNTKRYIRAVLDPGNSIPECSEANNVMEQEIFIVTSARGHDGSLETARSATSPPQGCVGGGTGTIDLNVYVRDLDLVGASRVLVTVTTDIGDRETFYVNRISPGVFRRNSFPACSMPPVTPPPPTRGNGVVEVSAGAGVITVQYVDQLDSNGRTVVRSSQTQYAP